VGAASNRPAALVVVNPAAGGGRTERLWRDVRDDLARGGLAFDWVATARPGDAVALSRRAATDGAALVVAVGGDGTLNEVVNGVADTAAPPAVGAILTGRGRDACRNLGLPREPRAAAARVLHGVETAFDLGLAEWADGARRWFVGAAGAGFDAAVARRAAAGGGAGTIPYVRAVVETLSTHRPEPVTVETDGHPALAARVTAVVVANGAHYGGGMKIAPAADPRDGVLDLVVLGDLGRMELLRWLPSVYRGEHLAHPRVTARPVRRVTIRAPRPLPTHVDGEAAPDTPVTLAVRPGALRLRV
jgi:YegS/Rv2252/BmrU family lipid kinase